LLQFGNFINIKYFVASFTASLVGVFTSDEKVAVLHCELTKTKYLYKLQWMNFLELKFLIKIKLTSEIYAMIEQIFV